MEKSKKFLVGGATLASSVLIPCAVAFADTPDLSATFSTAVGQVQTDFMTYASGALPIALGIAGVVLAIHLGWKLFKSFTK